jgi:hypothetical protein
MKKVYDAVAVIGEYKNKQGETKKNYLTVGTVFQNDDGTMSLKLNAVPVSFSGWINFYVPKEKESAAPESKARPVQPQLNNDNFDNDLPY